MSQPTQPGTNRRGFLLGGTTLGAGALLASCVGGGEGGGASELVGNNQQSANNKPGKTVTLGLSIPAADHGWMAAIGDNAVAQANSYKDVNLKFTEGTNDVNQQISQVKTLINQDVDVLALLPFNGESLTTVAQQAMDKGIPVVNIDRMLATPLAYRALVRGDNYGMGVNAGNFIAKKLKEQGTSDPVIVEVTGIDNLPLTQERSDGFRAALQSHGMKVDLAQSAEFTPQSGRKVMGNILQARPKIDAVWNHDDNQGTGVLAAIKQAGRTDEFFMVGGAGSKEMMENIKSQGGPVVATALYPPTMSASAVSVARHLGQGNGMSDLVEQSVPSEITVYSAMVTKENVDQYMKVGF